MLFLLFFGLIALIVIVLNVMNNSNLEKIENSLKTQNCKNIIYSKGSYKGICKDEVIQIPNSFSVDVKKDKKTFKFDKIKRLDKNGLTLIINDSYDIEFKDKKNMENFQKSLKEKID